jgi:hypothetical protein
VGTFLNTQFDPRLSADTWAAAAKVPWKTDGAPNHGFMLLSDDSVVGVYLAFYSERMIDGRTERICNLGAWSVLPDYRFHSMRLLKALLDQDGFHFTDLSPVRDVQVINTRFKFRYLDTTTALIPNIPWPLWPRRSLVSSEPELILRTLSGRELEIYQDHARALAARHLVVIRGEQWCYVMFRKVRRKNLNIFASILHVSNPSLFHQMIRPVAGHLLTRHGAIASLAELRVVGQPPGPSILLHRHRPKMFRSPYLEPERIDYLYSELVCVPW